MGVYKQHWGYINLSLWCRYLSMMGLDKGLVDSSRYLIVILVDLHNTGSLCVHYTHLRLTLIYYTYIPQGHDMDLIHI